jgi:DNA polymerase-3 subunit epsilon
MREIVFDTETTGLNPQEGDRIIEIGAVELENRFLTGRTFHAYVNPEGRAVHREAQQISGITDQFLADKPPFSAVATQFLEFVGDAKLVAHNAPFDLAFLNAEFARIGAAELALDRIIDTLTLARRRHPMGPNSLDALCQRYGIDNSRREKHGALIDSELLAEVYIELNGGRQASMILEDLAPALSAVPFDEAEENDRLVRMEPLASRLGAAELEAHRRLIESLGAKAIWLRYA